MVDSRVECGFRLGNKMRVELEGAGGVGAIATMVRTLSTSQPQTLVKRREGCEMINVTTEMLKSSRKGLKRPGYTPLLSCTAHGEVE